MADNKQNCPLDNNPEMQAYFNTLPIYVQENVKQSGVSLPSVEDLKKCAENLMSAQ